MGAEPAESGGAPDKMFVEIPKSLEEIKANMTRINDVNSPARPVQVGGSSGSTDPAPTERSGENLVPGAGSAPVAIAAGNELETPWQIGDGRAEDAHRAPVQLSEIVKGQLEKEPWQFQPYTAGDATWLHAAQRRHQHRRRANALLGVAPVDLSGPHEPSR